MYLKCKESEFMYLKYKKSEMENTVLNSPKGKAGLISSANSINARMISKRIVQSKNGAWISIYCKLLIKEVQGEKDGALMSGNEVEMERSTINTYQKKKTEY